MFWFLVASSCTSRIVSYVCLFHPPRAGSCRVSPEFFLLSVSFASSSPTLVSHIVHDIPPTHTHPFARSPHSTFIVSPVHSPQLVSFPTSISLHVLYHPHSSRALCPFIQYPISAIVTHTRISLSHCRVFIHCPLKTKKNHKKYNKHELPVAVLDLLSSNGLPARPTSHPLILSRHTFSYDIYTTSHTFAHTSTFARRLLTSFTDEPTQQLVSLLVCFSYCLLVSPL